MVAMHSVKPDDALEVLERRGATPLVDNPPHRRFYDSKFNQMKIPVFLGFWFVLGLIVLGYMLL